MNKHTPGRWKVDVNPNTNRRSVLTATPVFAGAWMCAEIAKVTKIPEHIANARLIAAAPLLLEALTALYDETADYIRLNNLGDIHHNRSMRLAHEAIKAATND
jgi:hypothetical protein